MLSEAERAVLAVIEADNRAFWMRDAAALRENRHHAPEMQFWGYLQGGGLVLRRGWADISGRLLRHIERFPDPVPELADAPISNLTLRVSEDMAWATFEREYPFLSHTRGHAPSGLTYHLRILEKHGGRWLIVMSSILDERLGEEIAVRVVEGGRIAWSSARATEQLRNDEHFVTRHGELRLRDRRQNARLLDMIKWAVGHDQRPMPQRWAMPIFLERDTGLPRISWVMADLGQALVLLDDPRPLRERIEIASRSFGLSPAQVEVALALAEGRPLKDYASAAGITLNTARTHLKRMFEKVEVSSQAGLVRALMSLSPPR